MREASAVMADLAGSGLSAKQLALVMELSAALGSESVPRRSKGAERQARYVERQKASRMTQNDASDGNDVTDAQKETSPDPLKKNTTPLSKAKALVPHRLPDDFSMPDDWKEWARETRGWSATDIETEAANFIDYWQARGSGAAKRDWRKTWQTWVRNSKRPDGSHRNDCKLTPDEVKERELRTAETYERIGRMDEAAELRRKWGTGPPNGQAARTITEAARKLSAGAHP